MRVILPVLAAVCGILAAACVTAPSETVAEDGIGFVIIGSNVLDDRDDQPTYIALRKFGSNRWLQHLPLKDPVFEVPAGRYYFSHVDFGEFEHTGPTMYFMPDKSPSLEVTAGGLAYFGRLEIVQPRRQRLEVTKTETRLVFDSALFRRACEQLPAELQGRPVTITGPFAEDELELPPCEAVSERSTERVTP